MTFSPRRPASASTGGEATTQRHLQRARRLRRPRSRQRCLGRGGRRPRAVLLDQRIRQSRRQVRSSHEDRSLSACSILAVVRLLRRLHERADGAADAPGTITFTKHVAPILQQKCQVCHQPDSIGPMPLITYEDAREYAEKIKRKVSQRLMPPWHIDRAIGIQEFKNDRSLSDEQIATLVGWVDAGTPLRRSEGHAAAGARSPIRLDGSSPRSSAQPDLVDQVGALHARRAHAGQVVPSGQRDGADRAALGAGDRNQAVVARRTPDRASRARVARAGRKRTASRASRTARTTCRRPRDSSWSGRSARPARSSRRTPAS